LRPILHSACSLSLLLCRSAGNSDESEVLPAVILFENSPGCTFRSAYICLHAYVSLAGFSITPELLLLFA
jgi:hypothetical protein